MKIPISTWVILGLAVVIALLLLFWPSKPENPNIQPLRDSIQIATKKLATLEAQNQALRDSIRKDSVEGVKESEAYRTKIKGLSKRLAELRPVVDSIIIDNPVLIEYVNKSDSTIEVQGWQIQSLEHSLGKLQVNVAGLTANFEQRIALEKGRYEDQLKISEQLSKDLKKKQRQARFAKVLIPIAFVGGLLIQ